jgi:hypothetical protein
MKNINRVFFFVMMVFGFIITSVAKAGAPGHYDLAITSFTAKPNSVVNNMPESTTSTEFLYYLTIVNMGSTPVALLGITFTMDDNLQNSRLLSPWGQYPGPTLNPGQALNCTIHNGLFGITRTLPAGRHIIKATINESDIASDLNKENNSYFLQMEVLDPKGKDPGWPDLYIEDIYTVCEDRNMSGLNRDITSGNPVKVVVNALENIGQQPALFLKGMTILQASEGNQIIGTLTAESGFVMKAGIGFAFNFDIPADKLTRPGVHEILIKADPQNVVKEANESNNLWAFFITVKGPDLAVTQVTTSPANPTTIDTLTLSVTVKNLGTGKATYYPQGSPLLSWGSPYKYFSMPVPAGFTLGAGQEYRTTVTIPTFAPQSGTYNLTVAVDKWGDPNEANNSIILPVTLRTPSTQEIRHGVQSPIRGATQAPVGTSQMPVGTTKPRQITSPSPQLAPPKITTPEGIR